MNSAIVSVTLGAVPAGGNAGSTPSSSIPIIDCATTIHGLAGDTRNVHKAFDETQRHILRMPDHLRPAKLVLEWRKLSEVSLPATFQRSSPRLKPDLQAYVTLLHASDVSATNLASTINSRYN